MPRSRDAGAIPENCGSPARHPGLDWIRGLGAVAVVLLHAGVPYLTTPLASLAWPVRSSEPDAVVNAVFWAIEACVMPLFLMLSGYVSWGSLRHRKERQFVWQRVERILFPMLAAACVLLPLELYLWMLGWLIEGDLSWRDFCQVRLRPLGRDVWGLCHLWYLQYVFLYSLILAGGVWCSKRRRTRADSTPAIPLDSFAVNRRLAVPAIVIAIAGVLWWEPNVVLGFQHSFLPVPSKFAYCGLFFTWGVLESTRTTIDARRRGRQSVQWLAVAALLFPLYLSLIAGHFSSWPPGSQTLLLAAMCLSLTRGLWLSCERLQSAPPRWGRDLAAASFWIYLIHHPLVALCHIALHGSSLPTLAQFVLSAGTTLFLAVASYEVAVRRTVIGRFLQGRSEQAAPPAAPLNATAAQQAA